MYLLASSELGHALEIKSETFLGKVNESNDSGLSELIAFGIV